MTQSERDVEWRIEYQTALGRMCGPGQPSDEQIKLARQDADQHVTKLQMRDFLEETRRKLESM